MLGRRFCGGMGIVLVVTISLRGRLLNREVSDGVIAPGFSKEALDILKKKKNGKYCMLAMDESYEPEDIEIREVYGVRLEQKRNSLLIDASMFL